jgi:hypothetical protein
MLNEASSTVRKRVPAVDWEMTCSMVLIQYRAKSGSSSRTARRMASAADAGVAAVRTMRLTDCIGKSKSRYGAYR